MRPVKTGVNDKLSAKRGGRSPARADENRNSPAGQPSAGQPVMGNSTKPRDRARYESFEDGVKLRVDADEDDLGVESESDDEDEPMSEDEHNDTIDSQPPPSQGSMDMVDTTTEIAGPSTSRREEVEPSPMPMSITSEAEAYQFLQTNPHLGNVFKKIIKEGVAEETKRLQENSATPTKRKQGKTKCGPVSPVKVRQLPNNGNITKSPSDTTIYAPALNKGGDDPIIERITNFVEDIRFRISDWIFTHIQHEGGCLSVGDRLSQPNP